MKDSLLQHDTVALNAAKDALHIIDQTKLPGELVFLDLRTQAENLARHPNLAGAGRPRHRGGRRLRAVSGCTGDSGH